MTPSEAEMVVRLLPRYIWSNRKPMSPSWTQRLIRRGGKFKVLTWTGMRRVPDAVDRILRKDGVDSSEVKVEWIDVRSEDIWTLQQRFVPMTLLFFIRNFSKVQRWKKDDLPVLIRFHGKVIVWNGTHRVLVALLLGRKLRVAIKTFPGNRSRR